MSENDKDKKEPSEEKEILAKNIGEETVEEALVVSEAIEAVIPVVEEEEEAVAPKGGGRRQQRPNRRAEKSQEDSGMIEQVIAIKRITKVTKGGKNMSFSALVVVGDGKGNVGYGMEKAKEVAIAIKKSMGVAKRNMVAIPMVGTSIPHEVIGRCGGSRVLLKPAAEGTGIIAAGPVRAICNGAGIHNILTKCHRSNNPTNVVKATMEGFSRLKTKAVN